MNPSKELPTVAELANLAAMVTRKFGDVEEAAQYAMKLWEACSEAIEEREEGFKFRVRMPNDWAPMMEPASTEGKSITVAQPKGFPASLNDFLRLVVGGPRIGERLATYRQFLKDFEMIVEIPTGDDGKPIIDQGPYLAEKPDENGKPRLSQSDCLNFNYVVGRSPNLAEIGETIELQKLNGFEEHEWDRRARSFILWKMQRRKVTAKDKARKAAMVRHSKKKVLSQQPGSKVIPSMSESDPKQQI